MIGLTSLVILAGSPWAPHDIHAQEGTIVVEGKVSNGTQGGGSVAGLKVVFHRENATARDNLETLTDPVGRFRFDDVVYDPSTTYGVSVSYQGAVYGTDLLLSAGSPPPITLTVYETVDKQDVLSAASASVLFAMADGSAQTVSALEIVKVVNNSDRTYLPGPEPMKLLRFGLPRDSVALQVDGAFAGADFIQVDRGFALLVSVPPGEHEVMYTYQFPYSGTEIDFSKSFPYGVERLRVLAPNEVLKLSSDTLGAPRTVTIGQRSYQLLEATDLPRGTHVSVALSGLPRPSLGNRVDQRLKGIRFEYAAPIGLGLFMVALIGFALWKRRKEERAGFTAEQAPIADDENQR